jgi:hypothetical protein
VSTIPRFPSPAQESEQARALRLAAQLTPIQRQVLAEAGLPSWLGLPHPWNPAPGRLRAVARSLTLPEYELLMAAQCNGDGAYRLTPLGELVAGIWLLGVITGAGRPGGRARTHFR